jgi:small conductance mechanosensitive channel
MTAQQRQLPIPGLSDFNLSKVTVTKVAIAVVFLVCAHVLGRTLGNVATHVVDKRKNEQQRVILFSVVGKAIYWVVVAVAVFSLPSIIGFEATAFVAVFGSVLFAIGLGLQGTLADVAAGIMLLGANTFRLGDYIEFRKDDATVIGKVKSFGILYTSIIDETSHVLQHVPNRVLYETPIINHSSSPIHVTYFEFVISNRNADVPGVCERLRRDVSQYPNVLKRDTPFKVTCNVSRITAFGTVVELRLPLSSSDFEVNGTINVQAEIMTFVRRKLDEYGVQLVDLSRPMVDDKRTGDLYPGF